MYGKICTRKEFDKKCTFANNSYYCKENIYYKFPLCEPYIDLIGKEIKVLKNYYFELFVVQLDNEKQSVVPLWFFSKVYEKKTMDIE